MSVVGGTGLLVSVRSAAEAQLALDAGVDLLDLKEPSAGALGAVAMDVVQDVLRLVAGRVPVSAALGELLDVDPTAPAIRLQGLSYVKLGLAGCRAIPDWPRRWAQTIERLPAEVATVAVAYADADRANAPSATDVLKHGEALGCRALLVDTFQKGEGDLFAHIAPAELATLLANARKAGMLSVLGGSLALANIPRALELRPDFIAVRGAACSGGRSGPLDVKKTLQLAQLVRAIEP